MVADGIILEIRRTSLDKPQMFSGLSIQNPIADTPGVDFLSELWHRFHLQKASLPNLLPDSLEVGVSSPGETSGCFTYFAGAEVNCIKEQPGLVHWTMPIGEYVVCSFEADNFHLLTTNALNKARDYMFGVWLPNHNIISEPFMVELYFRTSPEASLMEIWLKSKD